MAISTVSRFRRHARRLVVIVCAGGVMSLPMGDKSLADPCERGWPPLVPQALRELKTPYGFNVPFSTLIDINIIVDHRSGHFRVPVGYLHPYVKSLTKPYAVPTAPGIGFIFWWPSLHPVIPRSEPPFVNYPPPILSDTGIQVKTLSYVAQDASDYITPENQYKNFQKNVSTLGTQEYFETDFDLQKYRFRPRTGGSTIYYASIDNSKIQVLLTCRPEDEKWLNPGCRGDVFFVEDRLKFFISMQRGSISNWKDIVLAVRDFAACWTVSK